MKKTMLRSTNSKKLKQMKKKTSQKTLALTKTKVNEQHAISNIMPISSDNVKKTILNN